MMMCKCCDGSNESCNCMHHKMPMVKGVGLIVVGVVLFMTNYGWLDTAIWKWLLPLGIVLLGIHCGMMGGMKRMDDVKMMKKGE